MKHKNARQRRKNKRQVRTGPVLLRLDDPRLEHAKLPDRIDRCLQDATIAVLRQQVERLTAALAEAQTRTDREIEAHRKTEEWRKSIQSLRHTAEAQLAASQEAVRVLGELTQARALWEVATKMGDGQVETILSRFAHWCRTADAVRANPIAAAALDRTGHRDSNSSGPEQDLNTSTRKI